MVDVIVLGPLLSALVLLAIILLVVHFGANILWLVINSLIGLGILILLNFLPVVNITINIWSILIVALGGVPGIILLIILDVLKVAF